MAKQFPSLDDTHIRFIEDRGLEGVHTYWTDRNGQTIDGKPTR